MIGVGSVWLQAVTWTIRPYGYGYMGYTLQANGTPVGPGKDWMIPGDRGLSTRELTKFGSPQRCLGSQLMVQ